MELKEWKKTIRWRRRPNMVPPDVKIEDAANGRISISAANATKGKYQLELTAQGHAPITMNIEVI